MDVTKWYVYYLLSEGGFACTGVPQKQVLPFHSAIILDMGRFQVNPLDVESGLSRSSGNIGRTVTIEAHVDPSGGTGEEELRDTKKLRPGSDTMECALSGHCLQPVPSIPNPNTGEKIRCEIEHRGARTAGKGRHCILVVSGSIPEPRPPIPLWKREYVEFNRKVR